MLLSSQSIVNGQAIPSRYAFGKIDPVSHIALSDNINPHFTWSHVPVGTKSFVLICVDPDAPSKRDDVNQNDREVSATLPRQNFYHWVMVDIPADVDTIQEGAFSHEVTPKGKGGPAAPLGYRHGINDYTAWSERDQDMKGEYFGYDGPCPPFNDSLVHHYHFTIYALDIDRVSLEGTFNAEQVLSVIEPHILDKASIVGTYTLNPRLA